MSRSRRSRHEKLLEAATPCQKACALNPGAYLSGIAWSHGLPAVVHHKLGSGVSTPGTATNLGPKKNDFAIKVEAP